MTDLDRLQSLQRAAEQSVQANAPRMTVLMTNAERTAYEALKAALPGLAVELGRLRAENERLEKELSTTDEEASDHIGAAIAAIVEERNKHAPQFVAKLLPMVVRPVFAIEDDGAPDSEVVRLQALLDEATTIIELHDPNHKFLEQFEETE